MGACLFMGRQCSLPEIPASLEDLHQTASLIPSPSNSALTASGSVGSHRPAVTISKQTGYFTRNGCLIATCVVHKSWDRLAAVTLPQEEVEH